MVPYLVHVPTPPKELKMSVATDTYPFTFEDETDTKSQYPPIKDRKPSFSSPRIIRGIALSNISRYIPVIDEIVPDDVIDATNLIIPSNTDILIIHKYPNNSTCSLSPIARCVIHISQLDIADNYQDTTSQERLESFTRYEKEHPECVKWEDLIKKEPVVKGHNLESFLESLLPIYRQYDFYWMIKDSLSLTKDSPIYHEFEKRYLNGFIELVEFDRFDTRYIRALISGFEKILINEFGWDRCCEDAWFKAFFVNPLNTIGAFITICRNPETGCRT